MPRTRVKICGINCGYSYDAAVDHGADALGFVFASSPRQVSAAQVNVFTTATPVFVTKVAVFLKPSAEEVSRTFHLTSVTMYQSDGCDPPLDERGVQPWLARWLPVYRTGADGQIPAPRPAEIHGVIVEGPRSGVGQTCDWTVAAALARRRFIILAGGLTPDNVAEAIRTVRPYGVDVSSGVESSPGKKDPIKIRDFLQAVRDVDRERQ